MDNPFALPPLPGRYRRGVRRSYHRIFRKLWRHGFLAVKDAYVRYRGAERGEVWKLGEEPLAFWPAYGFGSQARLAEHHLRAIYHRLAAGRSVHPDALFDYPSMRRAFIDAGWRVECVGPARVKLMDARPHRFGGEALPAPVMPPLNMGWTRDLMSPRQASAC